MIGTSNQPKASIPLLKYWLDAHLKNKLNSVEFSNQNFPGCLSVAKSALQNGKIESKITEKLFANSESSEICAWVAPFYYTPKQSETKLKGIIPIWVPVLINRDGIIKPVLYGSLPWIPPIWFDPLTKGIQLFSKIESYDAYLMNHFMQETGEVKKLPWEAVYGQTQDLFEFLLSQESMAYLNEQYHASSMAWILPISEKLGWDIKVYCDLIKGNKTSALVNHYATLEVVPAKEHDTDKILTESDKILGHFPTSPYLSDSEKEALILAVQLQEGQLQALTTPPGTNKLILIKEFIATKMVEGVIAHRCFPTIVIAGFNHLTLNFIDAERLSWLARNDTETPDIEKNANFIEKTKVYLGAPKAIKLLSQAEEALYAHLLELHQKYINGLEFIKTFKAVSESLNNKFGKLETLEKQLSDLQTKDQTLEITFEKYNVALSEWQKEQKERSFLASLLKWLPKSEVRQREEAQRFIEKHCEGLILDDFTKPLDEIIVHELRKLKVERTKIHNKLVSVCEWVSRYNGAKRRWLNWLSENHTFLAMEDDASFDEYVKAIEQNFGKRLFETAIHFMEAKRLVELAKASPHASLHKAAYNVLLDSVKVVSIDEAFENFAYAKLDKDNNLPPIDYLVVDSANQMPAAQLVPLLYLSKVALIAGDEKLWPAPLSASILLDSHLQKEYELANSEEALEDLCEQGVHAASSAFLRAKETSIFKKTGIDGLHTCELGLKEQTKISPDIFSYSQKYLYPRDLKVLSKELNRGVFPPLCYVHVRGKRQDENLSYLNVLEAETLTSWLTANLRYTFNRSIAILTLYQGQKTYLQNQLNLLNINIPVYLLSEASNLKKDIILFSPVYTSSCPKPYLLDQGEYLLNVALTRAKETFMIFADMGIFDPFRQSPSGKLAKLLFKSDNNRVLHIPLQDRSADESKSVDFKLVGPKAHFDNLVRTFIEVESELSIISCQIELSALLKLNLLEKVQRLIKRQVSCKLYLSSVAVNGVSWRTPDILAYLNQLVKVGAQIYIVQGLHTNAYWRDHDYFAEGTQSWLAINSVDAKTEDESVSLIYTDYTAAPLIQEFAEQLINQTIKTLSAEDTKYSEEID